MITYVVGDLFTSPAKVLVNTVNTVGVMGKGIAKDFKHVYPEMFREYQGYCETGLLDVGKLWLYKTPHKWILNFPTKKHWRNKSKPEYIEAGLRKFADTYDTKGMLSVSFPMLGCGNGELDWESQVQPLMEEILRPLPIDIYIHLYQQGAPCVPEHRDARAMKKWLRSEPRQLPFSEFWEDVKALASDDDSFATLDGSVTYTARLDMIGASIHIEYGSEAFDMSREAFEEIWTCIRYDGYHSARSLPQAHSQHWKVLASFLLKLTYMQPIQISERANASDSDFGFVRIAKFSERQSQPQPVQLAS